MTTIEVRPVTAADRDALARFSCRSFAHPWTDEVETTIHHLADELEITDSLVARGVWASGELLGIVVWRMVPQTPLCQSLVLAVQTGHLRRGYARMLKQIELDEARQRVHGRDLKGALGERTDDEAQQCARGQRRADQRRRDPTVTRSRVR